MLVNLRASCQERFEIVEPQCDADREADGRPDRISASNGVRERQDLLIRYAECLRFLTIIGDRDALCSTLGLVQVEFSFKPDEGCLCVYERFSGCEGLAGNNNQR